MTTCVVLATGPSMSQRIADLTRGRAIVIAVSDAVKLAPWADALVSNDAAWWKAHPEALNFPGRKFCAASFKGTELLKPVYPFTAGTNSGLQGMRAAKEHFAASKILLAGFDMHGSHFFGNHPAPLRNTTPKRMAVHRKQFERFKGCVVINCTPGSHLKCFPFGDLLEELGGELQRTG